MKEGDYINILAPMRSTLKLKGNALMLFALIHGYSKDQVNRCRVSLSYMAEWLATDKAAISKLISKLHKAGYINKIEYYSGGVKCFEYTANYEALLVKAMQGEAMGLERKMLVARLVFEHKLIKQTAFGKIGLFHTVVSTRNMYSDLA